MADRTGMSGFYRRLDQVTRDYTCAEISRMTATHPETVRRYLDGINDPSIRFVRALCRAQRVSSDWLLFGRRPPVSALPSTRARRR